MFNNVPFFLDCSNAKKNIATEVKKYNNVIADAFKIFEVS